MVGCLGVVAVLLVVGGVLAYAFVVRPARQAFAGVQELARLEQLNEQVRERSSFVAPQNGELSEDQLERFLAVQAQMRSELEGRFEELDARYEASRSEGLRGFGELARAYGDLARLIVQAKEAQVAALNAQGFSLDEYAWVKRQVLAAAGLPLVSFDLGQLGSDQEAEPVVLSTTEAPEANRALVEPYRERLEETLVLAYFGL